MDENILEMAEAIVQHEIENGVKKVRQKIPIQPPDFDGRCVDCRDDIPDKRISFGAITCIDCQTARERKRA